MRIEIFGGGGHFGQQITESLRNLAHEVVVTVRSLDSSGQLPNIVIDVSSPEALDRSAERALSANCPLIYGTSGLPPEGRLRLAKLSESLPVVIAENFSLVAWIHRKSLQFLAGPEYSAFSRGEVIERHGRHKKDQFSATGQILLRELQKLGLESRAVSLRHGGPVNDHTTVLERDDSSVTVTSSVSSYSALVEGCLRAVEFAASAEVGLYSMNDVWDLASSEPRQLTI
jgi:4-hydroxy-tetrahydrodipicolinate reductase